MSVSVPARARGSVVGLVVSSLARIVLGALALLVLVSVAPAVAGWESTVVMSGSMEPGVQPGDITLVRPIDAVDLRPGQVLLVDDPDVAGGLRLHRLVAVTDDGLQLQGDANPTPDASLVDPAAVHGVGALRLPDLGLPVLWASQGRWLPLLGAVVALAALAALAGLHRSSGDDDEPGNETVDDDGSGRRAVRRALQGTTVALAVAILLPTTAVAVFSGTTANDANSFAAAPYFTCASAASGEMAAQYLSLQETSGTVAINRGTYSGNGTYTGGVSLDQAGPSCNSGSRSVRLDGSSGFLYTPIRVDNPQTFSTQLWFTTSTRQGGYLIGFGNGTSGDPSTSKDRLVYMLNDGRLRFGVYDDAPMTITTSRSYNDGTWHMVTATFSRATGSRLYVDGVLATSNSSMNSAEQASGLFRAGFDSLTGWPDPPTSSYFAGSIAHMGVFASRLTDAQVAAQYRAAN